MKSAIYSVTPNSQPLEHDFQEYVGSDVKFLVQGKEFNSEAPFVRNEVKSINGSRSITELTPRLNVLASKLLSTNQYSSINFQLVPNPTKNLCEVRVYPVEEQPSFGLYPFSVRGIGPYQTNTIKLDAEFYNTTGNYETLLMGRRYNFDTHGEKIFGRITHRLGGGNSLRFDANSVSKELFSGVKEESVNGSMTFVTLLSRNQNRITLKSGLSLTERHNIQDHYEAPQYPMRTQLYTLKFKLKNQDNSSTGRLCAKLGYDGERSEEFLSLSGSYLKFFNLSTRQWLALASKGGYIFGRNVILNDQFNYRKGQPFTNSYVSLKASVYSQRHTIFNSFGAQPFTYIESWLSSQQGRLKKELELGVGCYWKRIGLHLSFGLLDVADRTVTPSSRFQLTLKPV